MEYKNSHIRLTDLVDSLNINYHISSIIYTNRQSCLCSVYTTVRTLNFALRGATIPIDCIIVITLHWKYPSISTFLYTNTWRFDKTLRAYTFIVRSQRKIFDHVTSLANNLIVLISCRDTARYIRTQAIHYRKSFLFASRLVFNSAFIDCTIGQIYACKSCLVFVQAIWTWFVTFSFIKKIVHKASWAIYVIFAFAAISNEIAAMTTYICWFAKLNIIVLDAALHAKSRKHYTLVIFTTYRAIITCIIITSIICINHRLSVI